MDKQPVFNGIDIEKKDTANQRADRGPENPDQGGEIQKYLGYSGSRHSYAFQNPDILAFMPDQHIKDHEDNKDGDNAQHQKQQDQHLLFFFDSGDTAAAVFQPTLHPYGIKQTEQEATEDENEI